MADTVAHRVAAAEGRVRGLEEALERIVELERGCLDPELLLVACPDCGSDDRGLRKFRQRSARQLSEPARGRALAQEEANGTVLYSPLTASCASPWHNFDPDSLLTPLGVARRALSPHTNPDCPIERQIADLNTHYEGNRPRG